MFYPSTLEAAQKRLLNIIIDTLSQDARILGIGASGSYASDAMDRYSDLELVIAIDPVKYDEVMQQRMTIVSSIEGKIAAFSGEHVGKPRLIIALYEPDLIHVDFKFVAVEDAAKRVDDTVVLWEREGALSEVFTRSTHPCFCRAIERYGVHA